MVEFTTLRNLEKLYKFCQTIFILFFVFFFIVKTMHPKGAWTNQIISLDFFFSLFIFVNGYIMIYVNHIYHRFLQTILKRVNMYILE